MSRLVRRSARLVAAAAAAAALSAPVAASAQYFGQNKVQYRTFDFRILRTPHFDVYYYPEEESAARDGARMVERWYARYSRILDHEFEARQPLILYASSPEFQQTSVLQGDIGEGTGGVTEVFKQRIVLPFAGAYRETDGGLPIDVSGDLDGMAFSGPIEMGKLLSQNEQIAGCLVRNLYRYATGVLEAKEQEPAIGQLATQFKAEGKDLRKLMVELVASDGFRLVAAAL